jgi:hypothetical protein
MPPARTFASVVRSGVMPSSPCAPPDETRKPVSDLVEDQDGAGPDRLVPQHLQEVGPDRDASEGGARRLDDRRRDFPPMRHESVTQRADIARRQQQHLVGNTGDDAGRRRAVEMARIARGHMVVPAVEMRAKAHQLRPPRMRARA